jgi:hypothetical protein
VNLHPLTSQLTTNSPNNYYLPAHYNMNLSTLCAAICSLAITVTSAIPSSYSGPAASSDSSSVPNLKVYVILYKGQPSEPSEQSAVRATKDKAEAFLEGKGGVVVQNYDRSRPLFSFLL